MSPIPYVGTSDKYDGHPSSDGSLPFYYCRGNTLRTLVYQPSIYAQYPTAVDDSWGTVNSYIRGWAAAYSKIVLPILLPPQNAPNWTTNVSWDYFTEFAHNVAVYYNSYGSRCDAVEVFNETNASPPQGTLDVESFAGVCRAVAARIYSGNQQNSYGRQVTVVSGGIHMGVNSNWQSYFGTLSYRAWTAGNECAPYHLGVHPYDGTAQTDSAVSTQLRDQRIDEAVQTIIGKYDEAQNLRYSTTAMWVTETGCTSHHPFEQYGQSEVLRRVTNQLAGRPSCLAMMVYRCVDGIDDGGDSGQNRDRSLVHRDYIGGPWTPKTAWYTLF